MAILLQLRQGLSLGLLTILVFSTTSVLAHSPHLACFKNDDTVCCFSEFSDGSSTAGTPIQVKRTADGTVVLEGRVDETGEFCFAPPQQPYTVLFDAGPGHSISETSATIF